tara:strand:- start:59 stop:379 length:321 start_codon:yes stop_codon:yes gene_type:complete
MLKVILYTPSEPPQSSYAFAGFFELEKDNFLKCVIKFKKLNKLGSIIINKSKIIKTKMTHPKTSFYKLIKGNVNIKFAINTRDDATKSSLYALEKSEYFFKRKFNY